MIGMADFKIGIDVESGIGSRADYKNPRRGGAVAGAFQCQ
jgi:hypothetical protein